MLQTIQYYYKPEQPQLPDFIRGRSCGRDLSDFLSDAEKRLVEDEWRVVTREHPRSFSKPRDLGCL